MKHNNKQTAEFFVLGKAAKGSNFETDGTTATSYTTAIAERTNKGILIAANYRACSYYGTFYGRTATTERQKLHIKRACNKYGLNWYEVPNPFATTRKEHENNWQFLQMKGRDMQEKANRARSFERATAYNYTACRLLEEAETYWQMFVEA